MADDTVRCPGAAAAAVVVVGFPCWSRRSAGPSLGRLGRRDLLARLGGFVGRFRIAGVAVADRPEETPTAERIVAVVILPSVLNNPVMRAALAVVQLVLDSDGYATYSDRDADDDAY